MDGVEQGFIGEAFGSPPATLAIFTRDHVVADAPADYEAAMAAIPRLPAAACVLLILALALGAWALVFNLVRWLIGA